MSRYELDNLETARRCDSMIREIENKDPNVPNSVVPGSRLHEIIHNPVTEGIDTCCKQSGCQAVTDGIADTRDQVVIANWKYTAIVATDALPGPGFNHHVQYVIGKVFR